MARRTFTPEFKAEAVALVLERGLSASRVARDLGVGQPTISRWVRAAEAAAAPGALSEAERKELQHLRRELKTLRMERDILKRAGLDSRRAGAVASMSRKGDCWDNAVAESFFGTLEQELAGREPDWPDTEAVRTAVLDYIAAFYNSERRHSKVGQLSPAAFERRWAASQREAA